MEHDGAVNPPDADEVILTEHLTKVYPGGVRAVDDLNLSVTRGEIFGLLGPNGAGKSTTAGMLTTRVEPTEGRALVGGVDVWREPAAAKRLIGVVPQSNTLDRALTVRENLVYHGRFFGMSGRQARVEADQMLDTFRLVDRATMPVMALSGGMAQRLMVARAVMHRPEVLFLDEPTAGLDPQSRIALWEILQVLHTEGQTILLTTHYMEEAEALCDQIAVVDHGEVLAAGTVDELKAGTGAETVITVRYEGAVPEDLAAAAGLPRRPGVRKAETDGDRIRVFTQEPDGVLGELVAAGASAGLTVLDATQLKPSLETVFLNLTGREYRE